MRIILENDDGTTENIEHFILIACPFNQPPFAGNTISNIDEYYVPYILSDHSRWIFEERMK